MNGRATTTTTQGLFLMLLALLAGVVSLSGCKRESTAGGPLRIGYFPNVTHAQALVANQEKGFAQALHARGSSAEVKKFNAGPAAMEALMAGAIDVSYVGSGPAITTFIRSDKSVRIIAGSAAGGAALVVKTAKTPQELDGKRIATPQLGNTQDIALRHWLKAQGLKSRTDGGTVDVVPQANPDIFALFQKGEIEGAWVPEPWASRLVLEAGGKVLVDERTLWPNGQFPTTVLVATTKAIAERREDVKALLRLHLKLTREAQANPAAFAKRTNEAFAGVTGKPMRDDVLQRAFGELSFGVEPLEPQLRTAAEHAHELQFLPSADISGIVDATLLHEVEAEAGKVAP